MHGGTCARAVRRVAVAYGGSLCGMRACQPPRGLRGSSGSESGDLW